MVVMPSVCQGNANYFPVLVTYVCLVGVSTQKRRSTPRRSLGFVLVLSVDLRSGFVQGKSFTMTGAAGDLRGIIPRVNEEKMGRAECRECQQSYVKGTRWSVPLVSLSNRPQANVDPG